MEFSLRDMSPICDKDESLLSSAPFLTPIAPYTLKDRRRSSCEEVISQRREVTVNGADHGDVPLTFVVKDLAVDEHPVIGKIHFKKCCET